jgi:hypothetical protein
MTDTPETPENPDPSERRPEEYPNYPRYPAAPGGWQPPPKPGVIPLRPLGVGDIIGGAIATMRTRPGLMLGVTAVVVIITELLTLAVTYPVLLELSQIVVPDPYTTPYASSDALLRMAGLSIVVMLVGMVLAVVSRVFLSGLFTVVVGTAVLGQRPPFREVMRRVRSRLLPLLGLTLIYLLVLAAAGGAAGLLMVTSPGFGVLVMLAVVVLAVWLGILFSLATPALVLENVGVGRAFGRSRELVTGAWWRIFGITLLTGVIGGVTAFVIALPFESIGGGFSASVAPLTAKYLVISTIGAVIASTITEPFIAAVTALLYTDQRIRRERLDVELAGTATMS